jgi:hypothetical protein
VHVSHTTACCWMRDALELVVMWAGYVRDFGR